MEHAAPQGQGQGIEQAPGVPRQAPAAPPRPATAPQTAAPLAVWLRRPRPEAPPGVWRCGHVPRPAVAPERTPTRRLVVGAVTSGFICWALVSLMWDGYLGDYWLWPYLSMTPRDARGEMWWAIGTWVYCIGVVVGICAFFARIGRWWELLRRVAEAAQREPGTPPGMPPRPRHDPVPPPESDPARWPHLRAAGAVEAADRLGADLASGAMTDVDHARIERAWTTARSNGHTAVFGTAVARDGAAAYPHPSGARTLAARAAEHDLVLGQVRIGTAAATDRNPYQYRGVGIALEPSLLGTSALAVGPPGAGKTTKLVRPVVESLCLQALAGQAAVVVVTAAGSQLMPADAFDVVVRPGGGGESAHALDLYGGTTDPDEAAAMLAEALCGDLTAVQPGGDSRRAATHLARLLGPYRAAYGRFPAVADLRELLEGAPAALARVRAELGDDAVQVRELAAYERQTASDTAAMLAERVALLDRPAFADTITADSGSAGAPLSLRALDHPVRVRLDLPERGHAEAARILARLVLAQFTACATGRADRSRFVALVLDDASGCVTPEALRGLQQVRGAHAGVLLTLRGLDEVPAHLRGWLLGAVGCRMVCAGVTPWDADRFAEAWGTEWVETRTVTNRQLVSDEPMTRVLHSVRRLATGKHVTAESVTVRQEQRQRWSASDLANDLPPGHAVLSVTTVRGERTSPILVRLGQ
ncbi:ATP-binding protein [Streptomyces sp. NRRL F-6602]|nr:ATP-binding protein [Streptomyces sp. NRRL F-6602]